MKFNVGRKGLYAAVSAAYKIINSRNTLQILDNFRIRVRGGELEVCGSDVDNEVVARMAVSDCTGDVSICVPARRLVDLLKELPDGGLEIEVDESTLEVHLRNEGGEYNMNGLSGSEYPEYKVDDDEVEPVSFTLKGDTIIKGLTYSVIAVGDDDYRPAMKGIFMSVNEEGVMFVATDTHKMVRYVDKRNSIGVSCSCIMPVKPAMVMCNVINEEDEVHMTMSRKWACVRTGSYELKFKFINGRYPDCSRVIPTNCPYRLVVDRTAMYNAIRRINVFVDAGTTLAKFRLTGTSMTIKGEDYSISALAREEIPCTYNGQEMVIGFRAPYVVEFLNTLPTDEVYLDLSDPSRAVVFKPSENTEGTELLMLLMPMNVDKF